MERGVNEEKQRRERRRGREEDKAEGSACLRQRFQGSTPMLNIISHALKFDRVETIKEVSETPAVRLLLIGLTASEKDTL